MEYYAVSTSNALQHHGVLGQKWGVRRYQNPNGSLTAAGKAKLAKYKERELKGLDNFYNRNVRYGWYGTSVSRQGYKALDKEKNKLDTKLEKAKINANSEKIDKYKADLKVNEGKRKALDAMKKLETSKVKNMTFDQMRAEKARLGKSIAQDMLVSGIGSAILAPTTGIVYIRYRDYSAERSAFRRNDFKDPIKKKK